MYRLLIVDDEKYVVESLSELFSNILEPELEVLTAFWGMMLCPSSNLRR